MQHSYRLQVQQCTLEIKFTSQWRDVKHYEGNFRCSLYPSQGIPDASGNRDVKRIAIEWNDDSTHPREVQLTSTGWKAFQSALLRLHPVPTLCIKIAQNPSFLKSLVDGEILETMVDSECLVLYREDPGSIVTVREVATRVERQAADNLSAPAENLALRAFESLVDAKQSEEEPSMAPVDK